MIEVGDRVKDRLSGFTGIVTAQTVYLESCNQVFVRPEKLTNDGGHIKGEWFDEPWVELVQKQVFPPMAVVQTPDGRRISGGGVRPHAE